MRVYYGNCCWQCTVGLVVVSNHQPHALFLIRDMQAAADCLNAAIDSGEKICVYGDYDCDGVMATVILYSYLMELGADVVYYIPERSEGYGMNLNALETLKAQGVSLIVTVDNGIAALEEADCISRIKNGSESAGQENCDAVSSIVR